MTSRHGDIVPPFEVRIVVGVWRKMTDPQRFSKKTIREHLVCGAALMTMATQALAGAPTAHADNRRLNDSVVAIVHTVQHQAGCVTNIRVNPQLRLAAQWHTDDVLNNRNLYGDIGSDGSAPQDRARASGFVGRVAETVAVNPAVAISGIELINQWYHNPAYLAVMEDCANTEIGVWSASIFDRTVVVAVYGQRR